MRTFYEEWRQLESNSSVATDEITKINTSDNSAVVTAEFKDDAEIRQLQLANLNDDDRRDHEEAPIGIILCKEADKDYVGYIMQDFRQPMGVATYKTADEIDPELLKALPPKEELQRVFVESSKKAANE